MAAARSRGWASPKPGRGTAVPGPSPGLRQDNAPRPALNAATSRAIRAACNMSGRKANNVSIGPWVMSKRGIIGVGAEGRVSVATNQKTGQIVAVKRIAINNKSAKEAIRQKQKTLMRITQLAMEANERRILRFVEAVTDDAHGTNRSADVWLFLEPAAPFVLIDAKVRGHFLAASTEGQANTAVLIGEILGALSFLHANGLIHGDIKPQNIGWAGPAFNTSLSTKLSSSSSRVVLLDLDNAISIPQHANPQTGLVPPAPGTRGTIGFLAPELEMPGGFDARVDVWCTAVTALALLDNARNWLRQDRNPWREQNASLRREFGNKYAKMLEFVDKLHHPTLRRALRDMLCHRFAQADQNRPRPTAEEAIALFGTELTQEIQGPEPVNKKRRPA